MDIEKVKSDIAKLEKLLDEYREAKAKEAAAAYKDFVMEYEYSVTWPHVSQFRVERFLTPECKSRLAEFSLKYSPSYAPRPFEGGMTYSVLEGGYILGGGGSVIIETCEDRTSFAPQAIKAIHLESLRKGIVPDDIKTR